MRVHPIVSRRVSWGVGLVLAVLAGCSGHAPQCSFFSDKCEPTVDDFPPVTLVHVVPARQTVQVGRPAQFLGSVVPPNASATYQWRRSSDGGVSYVDIPGATTSTLTQAAANLADDGALFLLVATSNGVAGQEFGRLAVSSMPGVVFEDSEFPLANWSVVAVASPAASGPTHSEEAASAADGSAYRRMTHGLPSGAASLLVMHRAVAAVYDPSLLGAIHVVDFTEACRVSGTTANTPYVASSLLIEQAGRSYRLRNPNACSQPTWVALPPESSLGVTDLQQIDGPPCGSVEACPDFSGTAPVLRFGYARESKQSEGAATVVVHDIDDWRVTIWRR